MKDKPKLGDVVFCNYHRERKTDPGKLWPAKVVKVGRKYFTVKRDDYHLECEFHIDNWRQKTEFNPSVTLYRSEQEWADLQEKHRLLGVMRMAFATWDKPSLSLQQLQRIEAILKEGQ